MMKYSRRKCRVLFIQLPPISLLNTPYYNMENTPLAAGYLKAMAYKEGLLDKVEFAILNKQQTNYSSDKMLSDLICFKSPDILAFSLYSWNVDRSLYIIREAKRSLPQLKIIVGGPEVSSEATHIRSSPAIDIGVVGEGERVFCLILKSLLDGKPKLKDIPRILYRKGNRWIANPPGGYIDDVNEIPSPYLLGFLNPEDCGPMMLETYRGCSYQCKYCSDYKKRYPKNNSFSVERISKELKLARKKGIRDIQVIDSNFCHSSNYLKIIDVVKRINRDKKIFFVVSSRAEEITEKIADDLKECNVSIVEVGLQSINTSALENVNRSFNRGKFLNGVRLLKERNIRIVIDTIVGLPGDTLASIKKTVNFLVRRRLHRESVSYVLSLWPGCPLRKEAKRLGIKYLNAPPYFVLKTKGMSYKDICQAQRFCATKFARNVYPVNTIPYTFFITSSVQKSPSVSFQGFIQSNRLPRNSERKALLNEIRLYLNGNSYNYQKKIADIAGELSRNVSNQITVYFNTPDLSKDIKSIEVFIKTLTRDNPFLLFNVLLETPGDVCFAQVQYIKETVCYKVNIIDYDEIFSLPNPRLTDFRWTIRIFPIFSLMRDSGKNEVRLRQLIKEVAYIFWSVEFTNENYNQVIRILKRFSLPGGLLIDFHSAMEKEVVCNVLKRLSPEVLKNRVIRFKNYGLQQGWELNNDREYKPCCSDKSIICINQELEFSIIHIKENKSMLDGIEWKLLLENHASRKNYRRSARVNL